VREGNERERVARYRLFGLEGQGVGRVRTPPRYRSYSVTVSLHRGAHLSCGPHVSDKCRVLTCGRLRYGDALSKESGLVWAADPLCQRAETEPVGGYRFRLRLWGLEKKSEQNLGSFMAGSALVCWARALLLFSRSVCCRDVADGFCFVSSDYD
jgi:hypothetical protein